MESKNRESSSQVQGPKVKKFIIDETLFVYATRGDYELHSQLSLFLGMGEKKEVALYMTEISAKRLGMFKSYDLCRTWLTRKPHKTIGSQTPSPHQCLLQRNLVGKFNVGAHW